MPQRKNPGREIRAQTEQAVLMGLSRLQEILQNPESSPADVFKGLTLLFDHIYRPESGEIGGDFEVKLSP